jgi:hypothetical protein
MFGKILGVGSDTMKVRPALMSLLVFLLTLFPSCGERPTKVTITGGTAPTFNLSGSGELDKLYLAEADAEEQPLDEPKTLWELVPVERGASGLQGLPVETIGAITYGVVPRGYRQKTPASGGAPLLEPGRYYYFYFSTVNAPHAWGYFVIREGRAEFAKIRGRCIFEKDGKQFKGPCGEPEY